MDAIFKALNDPARRALLDSLRRRDGQTLSALESQLEMSRFGVMKHLRVLEDAHLVTTRKVGRFKHHYLNPLPLQEVIDRWVDPFLQPQVAAISALKTHLETETMTKPDFQMQTFIRCSRDALWDALTDAATMGNWHFLSPRIEEAENTLTYYTPDGHVMMKAKTLKLDPKSRIEATFEPHWEGGGAPSRTVMSIDEEGPNCRLTVEHYNLTFPVVPGEGVADGWTRWAAGLKTWLETGEGVRFNEAGALA
jgi:DNA-binding transcriptional ArsR family regulator/uncharacterized protein YndB with AHSA1/START domain